MGERVIVPEAEACQSENHHGPRTQVLYGTDQCIRCGIWTCSTCEGSDNGYPLHCDECWWAVVTSLIHLKGRRGSEDALCGLDAYDERLRVELSQPGARYFGKKWCPFCRELDARNKGARRGGAHA
jgi:hypothetical protein